MTIYILLNITLYSHYMALLYVHNLTLIEGKNSKLRILLFLWMLHILTKVQVNPSSRSWDPLFGHAIFFWNVMPIILCYIWERQKIAHPNEGSQLLLDIFVGMCHINKYESVPSLECFPSFRTKLWNKTGDPTIHGIQIYAQCRFKWSELFSDECAPIQTDQHLIEHSFVYVCYPILAPKIWNKIVPPLECLTASFFVWKIWANSWLAWWFLCFYARFSNTFDPIYTISGQVDLVSHQIWTQNERLFLKSDPTSESNPTFYVAYSYNINGW